MGYGEIMRIQLSDHFNYKRLLRFAFPSISMMVFTSIYGVIDGFFVSNYAGKIPFFAVNLIYPFLMILGAVGFMLGSGGTAIVSKLLGEKNKDDANKYFSMLVYITIGCGIVFTLIGELIIPDIARLFVSGQKLDPEVEKQILEYSILYGRIILLTITFFMLQNVFQSFFTTAEKPFYGFIITLISGCTNIVLDGILVGVVKMRITGAAIATCMSQIVGAVIPLIYFSIKNNSLLRLGKPKFNGKVLLKACTNGLSEFITNISGSLVSIVYNFQLLRLAGENGVSAYGVMMYVNFVYVAIFIGYSISTAPIIGYNYGANNKDELKNIVKKSIVLMGIFGLSMTILALVLAYPISKMYVGYDQELFEMTKNAFYIFSISFVFTGYSIYISSMFTALGNGLVSGLISFLRTIVFQIACVLIFPLFWGLNGAWIALLVAEILATIVAAIFLILKRKKYNY